jgi:hypothetical protein
MVSPVAGTSYRCSDSISVAWAVVRLSVSILLQLVILPAILIVVMVRSPQLQQIEQRCTEP